MKIELSSRGILPEPINAAALEKFLQEQQDGELREFRGFVLKETDDEPPERLNIWTFVDNSAADSLGRIHVDEVVDDANADANVRTKLMNRHALYYGPASLNRERKLVLISRPGGQMEFRGKMSTFGGPSDPGMRPDEPLAIVGKDNFEFHKTLFLGESMGGDVPLGRNLNPKALYLACRWDYDVTPRKRLKDCKITISNALTGAKAEANAVDWGPHDRTNRIADLSPGLADSLGLKTDVDDCVVTIALPSDLPVGPETGVGGPGGGTQLLPESQIIQLFGNPRPFTDLPKPNVGEIRIDNSAFAVNIGDTEIPQLADIRGAPKKGIVECHKLIGKHLKNAFEEVATSGLLDRIVTWDGLFVPRHIRFDRSRALSTHTWGIAFDINAAFNGFGRRPAQEGEPGNLRELVPILEKHGFYWGGRFNDGMHFQWGRPTV